jgi:hypothetical protein
MPKSVDPFDNAELAAGAIFESGIRAKPSGRSIAASAKDKMVGRTVCASDLFKFLECRD